MTDLFEEVEEELRRDQLKRFGQKVAPWAIGVLAGVVVIGGGLVGYDAWQTRRAEAASVAYDEALNQVQQGDLEGAFNAFGEASAGAPAIYRYMALSQQAGIRVQQRRNEDALALLDQAADAAPRGKAGLIVADFARIKAAMLVLDTAPLEQTQARLDPLTGEDRPYSAVACYLRALARLKAGRKDEARAEFMAVSALLDAPDAITQQAQAAVRLIDTGAADLLPDVTARTLALPAPQFELTPEMLQQLLQQQGAQGVPAQ